MSLGRVLIVGGSDGSNTPSYGMKRGSAEVWNPVTATFSPAGSLAEARSDVTGTLLGDGRVLIVGGGQGDDDLLATAEVWEPSDG